MALNALRTLARRLVPGLLVGLALGAAGAGCKAEERPPRQYHRGISPPSARGGPMARGGGPMDWFAPEALSISEALHAREIREAELALERARDPRVRAMAESIRERHMRALTQQSSTLRELNLRPVQNAEARTVLSEGDATLRDLQGRTDDEFDCAYVASQIGVHERSLQLMDEVILPQTHQSTLRTMVGENRSMAANRLNEARALQASLGTRCRM